MNNSVRLNRYLNQVGLLSVPNLSSLSGLDVARLIRSG